MYFWSLLVFSVVVGLLAHSKTAKFIGLVSGLVFFLTGLIIGALYSKSLTSDKEYWGDSVVRICYSESWETWHDETCWRTVSDGKDSKGNEITHQEPYDCSYCDETSAKYWVKCSSGSTHEISESEYWLWRHTYERRGATTTKIELNRKINYSHGCGQDGDEFDTEATSDQLLMCWASEHRYENRVQASESVFSEIPPTKAQKEKFKLQDYPKIDDDGYQQVIVGQTDLAERDSAELILQDFNGRYGKSKQIKLFIFVYGIDSHPDSTGEYQKRYFGNGNKNEFILCLGPNQNGKPAWHREISWTEEPSCQRIISTYLDTVKSTDLLQTSRVLIGAMDNWKRKHFKDFNYLNVHPDNGVYWWWILSLMLAVITRVVWMSIRENSY